jgi:inosine triphosphate pyrophosphatase
MSKIITFITGNKKKLEEVNKIVNSNSSTSSTSLPTTSTQTFEIQGLKIDLPELQGSPETIIIEKCRVASEIANGPVIVEDTSLCFNALCGLPGPYIKWFEDKIGLEGLNNLLMAYEDKSAYAKCIFAYTEGKGKKIHLMTGITNGTIVSPRGENNFGWDPIFIPEGYTETFAEMDSNTKNLISHRYKALQILKTFLN